MVSVSVSVSNGVLSDGNPNKRPLENGCHPSSCSSFQPKYKSRKVSAVRDFPPGCGRNASQIPLNYLNSQANALVSDGDKMTKIIEADCVKSSEIKAESQSLEVVKSPTREEMDDLVGKVMASAGIVNGIKNEELGIDVKAQGIEVPKSLENNALEMANELHQSKGHLLVKESNEVVGLDFVQESSDLESLTLVKCEGAEDKKPALEIGALANGVIQGDSAKSWLPPQPLNNDGYVGNETAPCPKKKYSRRRVSAIREFPPFCGRNAPQLTEEDRLRIVSGNKSLDTVMRVGVGSGELGVTLSNGVEIGAVGETLIVGVEGGSVNEALKAGVEGESVEEASRTVIEELDVDVGDCYPEKGELKGSMPEPRNKYEIKESIKDFNHLVGEVGKEIVVYSQERNPDTRMPLGSDVVSGNVVDRVIVHGLMAAPFCPWRQGKGASTRSDGVMTGGKVNKRARQKSKLVNRTSKYEISPVGGKSMTEKSVTATKAAYESTGALVVRDEKDSFVHDEEKHEDSPAGQMPNHIDVSLPPFGPNSSSQGDARNRVRETLRLFQAICRKLLQGEEAKSRQGQETKLKQKEKNESRIDLRAADAIKQKGKEVNSSKQYLGAVPGVEVGDEFQYRVELAIIGVHRLYQNGIDYMKHGGVIIATSIVSSGAYAADMDNADVLIYSGQGGNVVGKNKEPEDQKLVRGNLALKNSISVRNPVRVIRGSKGTKASDSKDARAKAVTSYVYDGLYTVENCWTDTGPHGKLIYMFELRRMPGQPELAWKEVKKSKKYKIRDGLCVDDISGGEESFPISAVNTIDDEKPPAFNYTARMIYRDWYCPTAPKGCDCNGKCSESRKCSCIDKNGGEIPYNYNGAIVEAKPLVYECGPSCKCPPSCYNRVSQNGVKIQLEIFKTESRGWGVRSLTFIPSGTFICEYAGELLEDKEAEQRIGNDEYLFDIGQNYNDCSHKPDQQLSLSEIVEDGGYTIDAAQYGNVGRFVNHSCSPNLYAQNVLYDNEDKRMPHIMFFAAENIPPLQELTYHYNYSVDQIRDSNGNIKMKSCYCGSAECTGRMY
ncbi:unnamed protein product [Ilex paraguariensis]|uniref:Uncharacterized protein n=1 Tax=Ilex paraguariensis TaxID=185542 RepID=A0ABC8TZQ1_9AQUA